MAYVMRIVCTWPIVYPIRDGSKLPIDVNFFMIFVIYVKEKEYFSDAG